MPEYSQRGRMVPFTEVMKVKRTQKKNNENNASDEKKPRNWENGENERKISQTTISKWFFFQVRKKLPHTNKKRVSAECIVSKQDL